MKGPRLPELASRAPTSDANCADPEPLVATLREWLEGLQARLDGHPSQPERTDGIMLRPPLRNPDTKH